MLYLCRPYIVVMLVFVGIGVVGVGFRRFECVPSTMVEHATADAEPIGSQTECIVRCGHDNASAMVVFRKRSGLILDGHHTLCACTDAVRVSDLSDVTTAQRLAYDSDFCYPFNQRDQYLLRPLIWLPLTPGYKHRNIGVLRGVTISDHGTFYPAVGPPNQPSFAQFYTTESTFVFVNVSMVWPEVMSRAARGMVVAYWTRPENGAYCTVEISGPTHNFGFFRNYLYSASTKLHIGYATEWEGVFRLSEWNYVAVYYDLVAAQATLWVNGSSKGARSLNSQLMSVSHVTDYDILSIGGRLALNAQRIPNDPYNGQLGCFLIVAVDDFVEAEKRAHSAAGACDGLS